MVGFCLAAPTWVMRPFSTVISWLRSTPPLPSISVPVLMITGWASAAAARKRKENVLINTDLAYLKNPSA